MIVNQNLSVSLQVISETHISKFSVNTVNKGHCFANILNVEKKFQVRPKINATNARDGLLCLKRISRLKKTHLITKKN